MTDKVIRPGGEINTWSSFLNEINTSYYKEETTMKVKGTKWIKGEEQLKENIIKQFNEAETYGEKAEVLIRGNLAILFTSGLKAYEKVKERRNK